MHPSALKNAKDFFDCYSASFKGKPVKVVEIGSQNVNGSIRDVCPAEYEYLGLDFEKAPGVDLVLDDPYKLPLQSESIDIVVSSSCFEHSELFWLVYLEAIRILKSDGIFYLNVPSNGIFHRYPVDCWRFYPDSGKALETWGRRNGYQNVLLESFTSEQMQMEWSDFVAIFLRDEIALQKYNRRLAENRVDISNVTIHGFDKIINYNPLPEDLRKLSAIQQIVSGGVKIR